MITLIGYVSFVIVGIIIFSHEAKKKDDTE